MKLVQQFRNNRFFILLGLALLSLGVLFLFLFNKKQVIITQLGFVDGTLISDGTRIAVSIADTQIEREQGLSGTKPLPTNTGKFFIFEEPGQYGFWMKDMNYSIDIIWLDEAMKVVSITESATPESYPEVFYPEDSSLYVLEVPAGFSTINGFKRGQSFTLEK